MDAFDDDRPDNLFAGLAWACVFDAVLVAVGVAAWWWM